jgi:protein-disulfide isomerase
MTEGLTKKQFKELRKLEKMQSKSLERKNDTVKWVAISIVCAVFLLLFVGIIIVGKNKNKPQTASGNAQFGNNGHARMLTKDEKDASVSANPAQKVVTMVEYGDIQCPACKAYYPLVKQVMAAYPGQLKLIFKNFPLTTVHPNAMVAAIAAEAAGKQGKYFPMVDILYERQDEWAGLDNPQQKFEEYVKELGMNVAQFQKDQKDPAIQKLIDDERNEGIQNGVSGTPTFFVNGEKIDNPPDIDAFKKIIGDALKSESGNNVPSVNPTSAPDKLPLQP